MKITILLSFLITIITADKIKGRNDCVNHGCVCLEPGEMPMQCPNQEVIDCYAKKSHCKRVKGKCGFTDSTKLRKCLTKAKQCYVNCSTCMDGTGERIPFPCANFPNFHCWGEAECVVQKDGECGFTQTAELEKCLNEPFLFEVNQRIE
jgi:hypothetical protein